MAKIVADSIIGCLLGTAVGDAMGLPYEGLSKRRQSRLYPRLDQHHLLFGKGMFSDDTEHSCMVAQALIVSQGNVKIFKQDLAKRLRFWLLGLPAGVGYATLRSILKLWLGFKPERAGVFSAGNGPGMRSTIIGVCYGDNPQKLRELVRASTRITHTDPKAELGALAVAIAAYLSSQKSVLHPQDYYQILQEYVPEEAPEFFQLMQKVCQSVEAGESTTSFALQLGLERGITGYIYHTVPIVIHAWLSHQQDYAHAILTIIRCGGDTDTTAAILGGIIGAAVGKDRIPDLWLQGLWEWPRTKEWIELLGERLTKVVCLGMRQQPLSLPVPGILGRNLLFLLIIIFHGFRRLMPPY